MFKKEKKVEENKKPKSRARKIIEWVFTGIFGVLIIALLAVNISRWTSKDGYIFNYLFPKVLSESMEPTYMTGEVIIVKKTNIEEIKVGDDVTFYYTFAGLNDGKPVMCTHRIVMKDPCTDGNYQYTFVAEGINKDSPRWSGARQVFHEDAVLGKVVGKSAFVGFLYNVFSSVWTLLVLILIPSLYLVISAILDMFKKIDENEQPKPIVSSGNSPNNSQPGRLSEMSLEEKEKLKKQLLDEMLNKKKGGK